MMRHYEPSFNGITVGYQHHLPPVSVVNNHLYHLLTQTIFAYFRTTSSIHQLAIMNHLLTAIAHNEPQLAIHVDEPWI